MIERVAGSQFFILNEVIFRPIFVLRYILIQVDFEGYFVELLVLILLICFVK
jgi:hypothetical protein